MPSPDEILPAALALHNSPRRYALLVGSGISRDTGILTAGEITDDLICQIAVLHHKKIKDQKPVDWYREQFGSNPTFTGLFSQLAKSKDDQIAILRQYFEPVSGDGKPEKIEPTPAHMSIARLVRGGVISMIITTNFDPLLEEAIKKETGKNPLVITHESDPRIMEVAGDHYRIVKINGSYPDTDLKLTHDDLACYEKHLAGYLYHIFSEYGLVICGWSGEHDTGLVDLLTIEKTRRFAIFWCTRDAHEKLPEPIRIKLQPAIIRIRSANEFFGNLESQIEILRRHERTTSLTVESAIKKIKDALRDSKPELLLSDLLHDETDRVLAEVNRSEIIPDGLVGGKVCFKNRVEELERISAPLAAMAATIAYYEDSRFADLITETIDRLINLPYIDSIFSGTGRSISGIQVSGEHYQGYFHNLRFYPALLTIYASGITAVQKGNFNNLSAILEKPRIRSPSYRSSESTSFFEKVNIWNILGTVEQWTLDFSYERFGKKVNDYSYPTKVIQSIVNPLIPNEIYYNSSFDIFEVLYGASYVSQSTTEDLGSSFALLSRVRLQTAGYTKAGQMIFPDYVHSYFADISRKIEGSVFFQGNPPQFRQNLIKYSKNVRADPLETGINLPPGGML